MIGPVVPWRDPLGQGPGHVRVAYALGSRDEPGNKVFGVAAPAPGGMGPAVDPAVENGCHIGGISEGPTRHKPRQRIVDVETACFGVAHCGEERSPGRAGRQGSEVVVGES